MKTHLYKKPDAVGLAGSAYSNMREARDLLNGAERLLAACGYKGAARGVHQANERVKDWMRKVDLELEAVNLPVLRRALEAEYRQSGQGVPVVEKESGV